MAVQARAQSDQGLSTHCCCMLHQVFLAAVRDSRAILAASGAGDYEMDTFCNARTVGSVTEVSIPDVLWSCDATVGRPLVGDVLRWRSDAWWREYRSRHAKWGGAAGRRPADLGNALQTESRIQDMCQEYLRRPCGEDMLAVLGGSREMTSLSDLALHRQEHSKFAEWAVFMYDITD